MTNWQDRLREADEALARELPPDETQRLRRTVVAAAASARSRRWSLPFALTAGSLATASVALVLATVIASPDPAAPSDSAIAGEAALESPSPGSGRQQLQFATPGGTRIIWVFDAEFEVKGTLP